MGLRRLTIDHWPFWPNQRHSNKKINRTSWSGHKWQLLRKILRGSKQYFFLLFFCKYAIKCWFEMICQRFFWSCVFSLSYGFWCAKKEKKRGKLKKTGLWANYFTWYTSTWFLRSKYAAKKLFDRLEPPIQTTKRQY